VFDPPLLLVNPCQRRILAREVARRLCTQSMRSLRQSSKEGTMPRPSPAIAVSLIALFVALSSTGYAGIGRTTPSQRLLLGPTITVTRDLPLERPSGWVMCPRGHQAVGGGYDSWRPPDYEIDYQGPVFGQADDVHYYRDTGVGVQAPASGWTVASVRDAPEGAPAAPLKVVVICAKVVRMRS
jgi:hypothetical protein